MHERMAAPETLSLRPVGAARSLPGTTRVFSVSPRFRSCPWGPVLHRLLLTQAARVQPHSAALSRRPVLAQGDTGRHCGKRFPHGNQRLRSAGPSWAAGRRGLMAECGPHFQSQGGQLRAACCKVPQKLPRGQAAGVHRGRRREREPGTGSPFSPGSSPGVAASIEPPALSPRGGTCPRDRPD